MSNRVTLSKDEAEVLADLLNAAQEAFTAAAELYRQNNHESGVELYTIRAQLAKTFAEQVVKKLAAQEYKKAVIN